MNQTELIGMVVALVITTGGVLIAYDVTTDTAHKSVVENVRHQAETDGGQGGGPGSTGELEIVNAIGSNIQDDGVKYVRFQVKYEGDGDLNLSDTLVQLETTKSTTDLGYRDGSTQRNTTNGFFTQ